jgi:hypothetical protein
MSDANEANVGMKHKLAHEIRKFAGIFCYLSLFFVVLKFYTSLILDQVNYLEYGLTFLKAFALAKVILTGEALRLGERFRDRPLIMPTLYKTLIFLACAFAFEVVEELMGGLLRGHDLAEAFTDLASERWAHLVARGMVAFVAFLPFFAFREMERVLGPGKLQDLFFRRSCS